MKKILFAGIFFGLVVSTAFAGNPIITHIFTSDPAAMVYNGRVYLYTGNDTKRKLPSIRRLPLYTTKGRICLIG